MKKLLMLVVCASAAFLAAFAGEDEVTVKVSVAGTVNNSALKKQCEVKGKKEDYKHELFMLKVEYLQQTDLHKYQVETRLLTLAEM